MTKIERYVLWITVCMFWFIMIAPDEIVAGAILGMICNLEGVTCHR